MIDWLIDCSWFKTVWFLLGFHYLSDFRWVIRHAIYIGQSANRSWVQSCGTTVICLLKFTFFFTTKIESETFGVFQPLPKIKFKREMIGISMGNFQIPNSKFITFKTIQEYFIENNHFYVQNFRLHVNEIRVCWEKMRSIIRIFVLKLDKMLNYLN